METVYELSANRPVFASSSQKEHAAYQIADGGAQYWAPQEEENAWVELDLEGEKEFTAVEVCLKGKLDTEELTVYLSSDGKNYVPLELEWKEPIFLRAPKCQARFIRLYWQSGMRGVQILRVWATR